MAPIALLIAVWHTKQMVKTSGAESVTKVDVSRAFPWFLFVFFVMSWCNTKGFFTPEGVSAFESCGKYLIILGMAGVGLNTNLASLKKVGLTPLFVGLLGALVVAAVSLSMIAALL